MGSTVFIILVSILVITLIVSTVVHEKNARAGRLKALSDSFGEAGNRIFDENVPTDIPALYEHLRSIYPDDFCIDDITEHDLAIHDVFLRMNRCVTNAGEDYLFCKLHMLSSDSDKTGSIYDRIYEHKKHPDKSKSLLCILDGLKKSRGEDRFTLIEKCTKENDVSIVRDIIGIILLAASVILIGFIPVAGLVATIVMIMVMIGTYFSEKREIDDCLYGLSYSLRMIRCAYKLSENGCDDFDRYKDLIRLCRWNFLISFKDESTSDPLSLIFDYVRMMFHTDLIASKLKLSGISDHADMIKDLYTDIGELDACLATASYIMGRAHCKVAKGNGRIVAKGIYHPLIDDPVRNDLEISRGMLLTGSNASGKSTFLKATGLNVIFAKSFGFALADSFSCPVNKLYTSMALSDNLLGAESYYVVEAKSIKRICDAGDGVLCIIDEVLRGTNTIERIAASYRILSSFCRPGMFCFAATHDLELTYLLDDEMDLYHFTEEINEDNVTFPYLLKEGRSDKTNAISLLAMLGFDPKITESAKKVVDGYKSTGSWSKI